MTKYKPLTYVTTYERKDQVPNGDGTLFAVDHMYHGADKKSSRFPGIILWFHCLTYLILRESRTDLIHLSPFRFITYRTSTTHTCSVVYS